MTIQTEISKAVYVGDGISSSVVIPFYFFEKQIAVYKGLDEVPLIEGTDYTLSGAGDFTGGAVNFTNPPAEGEVITIARNVDLTQLITFLEGEDFPASDYEYALDKLTMALQQIREVLSRAVVVPRNGKITPEEVYQMLLIINEHLDLILQVPELAEEVRKLKKEIEDIVNDLKNCTTDEVLEGDKRFVTSGGVYNHLQSEYYDKNEVDTKISESKPLQFLNISFSVTPKTVKTDNAYEDFPYRLDIPLKDVTSAHIPTVCFKCADAVSGRFAPVADAYDGGIRIYMRENSDYESCIPSIILH